jgi:hypothetical protein
MVKYESPRQLKIEEFKTPFLKSLLPDNRWVKLSEVVPWDKFATLYLKAMDTGTGRPAISPRIVPGALIIKHIESLDDRGTIAMIQENPYMQYFLGLEEFDPNPVFDVNNSLVPNKFEKEGNILLPGTIPGKLLSKTSHIFTYFIFQYSGINLGRCDTVMTKKFAHCFNWYSIT